MTLPRKGVFHVKLKLVDLPVSKMLDECLERRKLRHLAACAVVVDAATREVGPVFDDAGRDRAGMCPQQLAQRLDGVVSAGIALRESEAHQRA